MVQALCNARGLQILLEALMSQCHVAIEVLKTMGSRMIAGYKDCN